MNTIKLIDVFGQYEGQGTGHYFTFLPTPDDVPSGWRTVMKDPRNEVSHDLDFCYAVWCTSTDWWIAKLVRNPHDPKGGFAMLSICMGPNRPADGEKAAMMLDQCAQFFLIDKNWNQDDAEKALLNYGQDLEFVPCKPIQFVAPSIEINSAYRSYETRQELGKMLSLLPQSGYENYSRIFFVSKEMALGMPAKCIDELLPIRNIYSVQCPANCTVSKIEVMDGEDLIVTYTKPGMEPIEKVISVGKNSDIVRINGASLSVKSEEELGLYHNRVIEVRCRDKKTGEEVSNFKLTNYTQQYSFEIRGNKVYFSEDFSKTVVLRVNSYGSYDERTLELNPQSFSENVIWVELESKEFMVVFRLGSTDYLTTSTMNPSSARMKWRNCSYDVDDRDHKIVLRVNPEPIHHTDKNNYDPDDRDLPFFKRVGNFFNKNWTFLFAGLLGLLIVYAIYAVIALFIIQQTPWPFGEREVTIIAEGQTLDNCTQVESEPNGDGENTKKEECDEPVFDSVAWNADVNYLKKFDEWNKDSLRTVVFQTAYDALHTALAIGDVEGVIQSDSLFNSIAENRKNGYYKDIIKGLRAIQKSKNQDIMRNAGDELKRISKKDKTVIAIGELRGSVNSLLQSSEKTQGNAQPEKQNISQTQKGDSDNKTNTGGRPGSSDQ